MFAKPKLKLKMRRKAWRPINLGIGISIWNKTYQLRNMGGN